LLRLTERYCVVYQNLTSSPEVVMSATPPSPEGSMSRSPPGVVHRPDNNVTRPTGRHARTKRGYLISVLGAILAQPPLLIRQGPVAGRTGDLLVGTLRGRLEIAQLSRRVTEMSRRR
jgi:hypothetical protein